VVKALEEAVKRHGKPKTIKVDNGPEFISKDLDLWAYCNGVKLDFSRPGKPTDNALLKVLIADLKIIGFIGHQRCLSPPLQPIVRRIVASPVYDMKRVCNA
jgi:Integrase core domain